MLGEVSDAAETMVRAWGSHRDWAQMLVETVREEGAD